MLMLTGFQIVKDGANGLDAVTPRSPPLDTNASGDFCRGGCLELLQTSNSDMADMRNESPVHQAAGTTDASGVYLTESNHDACQFPSPSSKSGIAFHEPFLIPDQVQCEHSTVWLLDQPTCSHVPIALIPSLNANGSQLNVTSMSVPSLNVNTEVKTEELVCPELIDTCPKITDPDQCELRHC